MNNLRLRLLFYSVLGDDAFFCRIVRRDLIHQIHHRIFHDCAETSGACFPLQGFLCNRFECIFFEIKLYAVQLKQLLVLFDQRILRLNQNLHQGRLIQRI